MVDIFFMYNYEGKVNGHKTTGSDCMWITPEKPPSSRENMLAIFDLLEEKACEEHDLDEITCDILHYDYST